MKCGNRHPDRVKKRQGIIRRMHWCMQGTEHCDNSFLLRLFGLDARSSPPLATVWKRPETLILSRFRLLLFLKSLMTLDDYSLNQQIFIFLPQWSSLRFFVPEMAEFCLQAVPMAFFSAAIPLHRSCRKLHWLAPDVQACWQLL